ncbi:hypothetical protein BDV59DRAFT_189982 [Aspergillus ambiguus]|uniref:uncharacterized protein n=1 Tax=Aspergillus ambiguus TaxID=176160 RepID=UPI003CCCD3C1
MARFHGSICTTPIVYDAYTFICLSISLAFRMQCLFFSQGCLVNWRRIASWREVDVSIAQGMPLRAIPIQVTPIVWRHSNDITVNVDAFLTSIDGVGEF